MMTTTPTARARPPATIARVIISRLPFSGAGGRITSPAGLMVLTAELAASAILGAPLGHDHATISLSDLHTPWDVIERRLQAIAEGDFVVALYNPRSRKRTRHLPRALEILAARRPPGTPVAVVQDATRPGENHRVAPLSEFDPEWVDMHSIVIVGSSTTRMVPTGVGAVAMVTPRDYKWLEER